MVWHTHEDEDEFFQVIKGRIVIHLKDQSITLNEGECFIVPKGVEHKPEAIEEYLELADICEMARYSPTAIEGGMEEVYSRSIKIISQLEQNLR